MSWLKALILGIIQGITEFFPISSSGHIELAKKLLGLEMEENLLFTSMIHAATVLSIIIVFHKSIRKIMAGLFTFKANDEFYYSLKLILSMIPVAIIGFFFRNEIENIYNSDKILLIVGWMLVFTAIILSWTYYAKSKNKKLTYKDAFIIGVAQMIAVLPGISRSGTTIAVSLLLGNSKKEAAQFSFLMVLVPILGENILSLARGNYSTDTSIEILPLIVGFLAAFITGLLTCRWMINIVKKGKLVYFAIYCLIVGTIVILFTIL